MPPEADLLFVLLALQMNLLSRERLLEAAAAWMSAPGGTLAALLESRGFLPADKAAAVRALVEARFSATVVPPRAPATAVRTLPVASPGRYELKAELGRGGLGRVVEAWDDALRRQVAVKLLHAQPATDAPDRFAREARLAARLEHPAIIPVYDFGALPSADGRAQVFLAMKRVVGRDLDRVLRELEEGRAETRRTWSRARLLRVFQDVCLGMAFAHDRGIVHRDLKPSNIMIGDYGETLIVDWGLAKELKPGAEPAKAGDAEPVVGDPATTVRLRSKTSSQIRADSEAIALSHSPMLTFAGDILGTPAYMSPEQAEGRVDDIDARSDIFALGAILYEILALRPPFEGASVEEVMSRVRDGAVTPPSRSRIQRTGDPSSPSGTTQAGDSVPPELDAICLRALAHRPADRYQSARDLHDDIQLFLEGAKERDRRRTAAESAVAQVREALSRRRRLREEAAQAAEEARRHEAATAPLADKAALWAAEDRARGLRRQAAAAHADAVSALTRALDHDRDHKDARALMADVAWESYVEAEEAGDEAAALVHRRVVEEFHDGRLEAQLRGEGTLHVRTVAYPCDCLVKGRTVFPEELASGAWHPFSGRSLTGTPGAEGLPALEPAGAARLRVHGALCAPADIPGADVWLFRHEESGRRLVPVTPHGLQGPGVPEPILDALFGRDSPFRPRGAGFHLGRTPVEKRTLPMGSYLLVLAKEGRAPARVPVFVGRGGHVEQRVTLFRPGEIPEGFSAVAEGTFGYQGDRENPYSGPADTRDVPAFFLANHPVTCREYAEFLNALPPEEAARRAPRASSDAPPLWPGPPWTWKGGRPVLNTAAPWEADWPVVCVSWEDAMACAAWKRSREGRLVTLPTGVQWEKAARGPDRRIYPWGSHLDPRWANGERSHDGPPRPAAVGAFPGDESPYGVRGLAGNTRDACLDDAGSDWPGRRWFRGGTWARPAIEMRASDRTALGTKVVVYDFGFRLAIAAGLEAKPRA